MSTIEISYGTLAATKAWKEAYSNFRVLFSFLPRPVIEEIENLVTEIIAQEKLFDEKTGIEIMDNTLASKGYIFGIPSIAFRSELSTTVERKLCHSVRGVIIDYVGLRRKVFSELFGLTGDSIMETLTAVLSDVRISSEEVTPEVLYKEVMKSLAKHSSKLSPLTHEEWVSLALDNNQSLTMTVGRLCALPGVGDAIAKKLIKSMRLSKPWKYFKKERPTARSTLISSNIKVNKNGEVSGLGKMPYGTSLIKKLSNDQNSLGSIFKGAFSWMFKSTDKSSKESTVTETPETEAVSA